MFARAVSIVLVLLALGLVLGAVDAVAGQCDQERADESIKGVRLVEKDLDRAMEAVFPAVHGRLGRVREAELLERYCTLARATEATMWSVHKAAVDRLSEDRSAAACRGYLEEVNALLVRATSIRVACLEKRIPMD